MNYMVVVLRAASKELHRLPAQISERIEGTIDDLADDPMPEGSKKLKGTPNSYRIRIGDYRILYEIDQSLREVTVFRVAHRSEADRRGR